MFKLTGGVRVQLRTLFRRGKSLVQRFPEGKPVVSDVAAILSGISGLSFDSPFLISYLISCFSTWTRCSFCLVIFLLLTFFLSPPDSSSNVSFRDQLLLLLLFRLLLLLLLYRLIRYQPYNYDLFNKGNVQEINASKMCIFL